MREHCPHCGKIITDLGFCCDQAEQDYSEEMHRQNDPHYISDWDVCDPVGDDEEDDAWEEPRGSCENCGVNLYGPDDYDGYCEQCAWTLEQGGEPSEDDDDDSEFVCPNA
jgi:hypothetical protein